MQIVKASPPTMLLDESSGFDLVNKDDGKTVGYMQLMPVTDGMMILLTMLRCSHTVAIEVAADKDAVWEAITNLLTAEGLELEDE